MERIFTYLPIPVVLLLYVSMTAHPVYGIVQLFCLLLYPQRLRLFWMAAATVSAVIYHLAWHGALSGYLAVVSLSAIWIALCDVRADEERHARLRPWILAASALCLASLTLREVPIQESAAWSVTLLSMAFMIRSKAAKSNEGRTHRARNALLLAMSLLCSMVIFEVGARFLVKPLLPKVWVYGPHPERIYTPIPGREDDFLLSATEGEAFQAHRAVSVQGIQGTRIFGKKDAHEFRILILGDSFTEGASTAWEDTFSEALETLLKTEGLSKQVVVINGGVGGYAPWQERSFLLERGLPLEPDLVLHQLFTANDVYETLFQYDKMTEAYPEQQHRRLNEMRNAEMLRYRIHEWVLRRFRTYQLIWQYAPNATIPNLLDHIRGVGLEKRNYPASSPRNYVLEVNLQTWYPALEEGWELFKRDVLAVKSECEERGIDYIGFCLPYYVNLRDDVWDSSAEQLSEGQRYVRDKDVTLTEAFYREQDIDYVNVLNALRDGPDQSELFHHPNGHQKKEGSWIIARELRDYLVAEYFPKKLP